MTANGLINSDVLRRGPVYVRGGIHTTTVLYFAVCERFVGATNAAVGDAATIITYSGVVESWDSSGRSFQLQY